MEIAEAILWWFHFLLGIFSYLTGVQVFPEQFYIGATPQPPAPGPQDDYYNGRSSFCQDIQSSLHELSPIDFFLGEVLTPSDGYRFGEARDQYASVTFAQQLSPNIIALVASESDVQAAVTFASQCGYTVSIRSGGHSYLGTSSCDSSGDKQRRCLQIDVTGLNQHVFLPESNQVRLGPGNRLKDVADFLKEQGQFLPTGECPGVAVGGHMQTGGFGLFTRHFGPFASRVESFRIVLADGSVHQVVAPNTNSTNTSTTTSAAMNDDLFYAVLGGASGSWGVVTEMTLNTLKDDDYFSVYWKLAYWWDTPEDTDGIVRMLRVWSRLAEERKEDWRWGAHWSVVGAKNVPGLGNRIQLEGSWVAPKSQADDYDFEFFQAIDNACTNCRRFRYINVTEPLSEVWRHRYIRTRINKGTGREFPVPYTRAMQQFPNFPGPDEMENITREIAKLLPHRFSPHFMISQLTTIRGAHANKNDEDKMKIALPWPNDVLGVTLDYFYIPPTQYLYDYEELSRNFGQVLIQNSNGSDHRMMWAAYDAPNMGTDWPQYYDSPGKYKRLQGIKRRVDSNNLFQNKMSIPPIQTETTPSLSSSSWKEHDLRIRHKLANRTAKHKMRRENECTVSQSGLCSDTDAMD